MRMPIANDFGSCSSPPPPPDCHFTPARLDTSRESSLRVLSGGCSTGNPHNRNYSANMPIFQDPDRRQLPYKRWGNPAGEGDGLSTPTHDQPMNMAGSVEDEPMPDVPSLRQDQETEQFPKFQTSDREELIRSIKRGESPTWVPNSSLEKYFASHGDPPHLRVEGSPEKELEEIGPRRRATDRSLERQILPAETCPSPRDIERPRSALHSGDFREGSPEPTPEPHPMRVSGHVRHCDLIPSALRHNLQEAHEFQRRNFNNGFRITRGAKSAAHSRSPSLGSSFSSSYVLKAPTSPLVHQANNPDIDFSPRPSNLDLRAGINKANRRRTLPSQACRSVGVSTESHSSPGVAWQREQSFPVRSHQSRKSITSPYTLQLASSPQNTGRSRFERQSFSTDGPPHRSSRTSMVGSYEESILRGRMSTNPSKPLDFTAQIGVLGRGNCKPNLKCPSHVTVPFPAVFYSYSTSGKGRSISDDNPSPYVGFIDLENSLPPERRSSRRSTGSRDKTLVKCPCHPARERDGFSESPSSWQERRVREKISRRSSLPQAPPGGCYRIPQQGQLQIIIKNPNKTAVKLFLVPYDLEGMEPGTKTFIRQRSYSVGSVIEAPLDGQPTIATESTATENKPVLRYLVHLNICCTSKDRFYLHSGVRVVFANRVPDAEERLRNEIQCPEPRYSPYRPTKDNSTSAKSTAGGTFGRRDTDLMQGISPGVSSPPFCYGQRGQSEAGSPSYGNPGPIHLPPLNCHPGGDNGHQVHGLFATPVSSPPDSATDMQFSISPLTRELPTLRPEGSQVDDRPFDAFGTDFSGKKHRALLRRGCEGESLLARKLKSLDVMKREVDGEQLDGGFQSHDPTE